MSRFSLAVIFSLAVAAKADIYGCFAPATADVSFGAYEIDCGSVVPYSTGHYAVSTRACHDGKRDLPAAPPPRPKA